VSKSALLAVRHMLEAITYIREDTSSGTALKPGMASDRRLRQLVERNLEIISEASRRIPDDLKARHPHIPWRQVADIGNVLRHEYQKIDPEELRLVVERDLPPLERAVMAIRAALEGRSSDG